MKTDELIFQLNKLNAGRDYDQTEEVIVFSNFSLSFWHLKELNMSEGNSLSEGFGVCRGG